MESRRQNCIAGKRERRRGETALNQSPLLFRYETGLMSKDGFFRRGAVGDGFSRRHRGIRRDLWRHFYADTADDRNCTPRCGKRNLPTYIFSNTNELAIGHIRRNFPFFNDFDGYIFSYEHRAMKPQAALYEAVERVTGRAGGAIIYVDDRPENIEAGRGARLAGDFAGDAGKDMGGDGRKGTGRASARLRTRAPPF